MRTFVAIDLDDGIRRQLGRAQGRLQNLGPPLKWVRPEQIHLTLKFLGETPDRRLAEISAALDLLAAECQSFDISIESLGAFPPEGALRVVWAGISDPDGRLAACHRACEERIAPIGFPPEGRAFSPHLTLARAKSPIPGCDIRDALAREGKTSFGVQTVEAVTFYQSTLTPRGPLYAPLSRHPFGA